MSRYHGFYPWLGPSACPAAFVFGYDYKGRDPGDFGGDFDKDRHNAGKAYGGIKAEGDEAVPTR